MSEALSLCVACGATLKPGIRFCGKCGSSTTLTAQPHETEPAESGTAVQASPRCSSCDKTLKSGALFCPACGAPQDADYDVHRRTASPRLKRRSTRPLILGVSMLVVVLAIGAAAAFAWWRFRDAPTPDLTTPPVLAATAPTPVDAVPVIEDPAQPPFESNASAASADSAFDAAANADTAVNAAATADAAARDAATAARAAARRAARRNAPAARSAPPPADTAMAPSVASSPPVLCIRPDGSETQTSRANCRAQGGVIY